MKKLTMVAAGLVLGASAFASKSDMNNGMGYGAAGCGFGSMIFGDKPGIMQVLASTTNGVSGSQTFGITTGTLNCDGAIMSGKADQFIDANREMVARDASRGAGETINSLAKIYGCENSADLGANLQKGYSNIFNSEASASQIDAAIKASVKQDAKLAQSCNNVG